MKRRLTDKFVKSVNHSGGSSADRYSDEVVKGFYVRVTKAGNKAFGFRYEFEGRGRSISIGDYPAWSVSAARDQAAKYRRQVDAKEDPRAEADKQAHYKSLDDFWEWYEAELLARKAQSTRKNETSIWKRLVLPRLGAKKVRHITRSDVSTLFREVSSNTPTQANRMLASLLYAFRQALLHGMIPDRRLRQRCHPC